MTHPQILAKNMVCSQIVLNAQPAILYRTPRNPFHTAHAEQFSITAHAPSPVNVRAHRQPPRPHPLSVTVHLRPRQHLAKQRIIRATHVILAIHVPPSPSVTNAVPTQQQNTHVLPTNLIATKQHACLIRRGHVVGHWAMASAHEHTVHVSIINASPRHIGNAKMDIMVRH